MAPAYRSRDGLRPRVGGLKSSKTICSLRTQDKNGIVSGKDIFQGGCVEKITFGNRYALMCQLKQLRRSGESRYRKARS